MFSRVRFLIVGLSFILVLSCSHKPDTKDAIVIPFELVNNRIVITATVNDSVGRYMLDTGASMTFTDVSLTNLPYVQTSTIQYVGVSERHKVYKLPEITINNQKIASDSLVTNNSKPLYNDILTPNRLNGVLGLMAFSGYWCEISFSDNMIYLRKNEPAGYRTRIIADFENYMIVVPSRVDTVECRMVLDTGFPRRVGFPASIVPKIDNKNKTTVLSMGITQQQMYCEKLTSLGKSFRGVFGYADSPFSYTGMGGGLGALGVPFLQKFDMAFDLTESKTAGTIQVLTRPNTIGGRVWHKKDWAFGLHGWFHQTDGFLVSEVAENSPCARLGILPRTVITHVDGIPLAGQVDKKTERRVWKPDNGTVFTIKNDSVVKTVTYEK